MEIYCLKGACSSPKLFGLVISLSFFFVMTDSVYLTIFLPRYVCEAPERRQIKSIYLHSAFSRLLTYWAPSGPRFPKLGKWGGLISWNGGGGQESPARSNSTSFGYLLNSLGKEFWKLARGWDRLGAGHNQP